MRKLWGLFLSAVLLFTSFSSVRVAADDYILGAPTANTYTGRKEAVDIIKTANYADVANGFWAKESIVRGAALNIIAGQGSNYLPNSPASNQDALAFVLRAIGLERASLQARVREAETYRGSPIASLWSLGYLNQAMQIGLITQNDYYDALAENQAALDPEYSFLRGAPAKREQVADWLVKGLRYMNANAFAPVTTMSSVYAFSDWQDVEANKLESMEIAIRNGIIAGATANTIAPKASLTRAQMAQMLANMDSIYYNIAGIQKKSGTVSAIADDQLNNAGSAELTRNIMIRTADGLKDVIQYNVKRSSSPQDSVTDVVVFRGGRATGLTSLKEGDRIEYLVKTDTGTALYVNVVSELERRNVQGALSSVDLTAGTITVKDAAGKTFTYPMASGLYNATGVTIDSKRVASNLLPFGGRLDLTLENNTVVEIKYLGEPIVVSEFRGIVVENNPDFGYITVLDNNGDLVTKNYYENNLKVQKQQYYDINNMLGYITEVFPSFKYNPLEAPITEIEPGDIVFIRLDPNDADTIKSISAATNYNAKYVKITQISRGELTTSITVEYENKQMSFFDVASDIFISKEGRPISMNEVQVGDWARVLINQAQIEPGYIWESIKQIKVEGSGHIITTIVKGQLSGINAIQKQMNIQNAQTLSKTGWGNYQNVRSLSLKSNDIEYYLDGRRISLDFAVTNLKRADGEVYIALEGNFAGERVKKVTFRTGRDEILDADTVMSSDGNGKFSIIGNSGEIATDAGSIVIRNGRLVSGNDILPFDYVNVALNGQDKAAVVNIDAAPDVSQVNIARVRIKSVKENVSFTTTALSILTGNEWVYSPIEREFTIGYDTLFLDEAGPYSINDFLGYTEDNVINNVYYVIFEGSKAKKVITAPYSTSMVRGTIYASDGTNLSLKDVAYYQESTGKWLPVSNVNNTATIIVPLNVIVAKNNSTINAWDLRVGDQIKVFTDSLPAMTPGFTANGFIIICEK